jgi:hypothetical protein
MVRRPAVTSTQIAREEPDNPARHMRRPPASGSRLLTSAYRTREHGETACRSFP